MSQRFDPIAFWNKIDYRRRTFLTMFGSTGINIFFVLYNAFLAVNYHSLWNRSMIIYYFLLSAIKARILYCMRVGPFERAFRRKVCIWTHWAIMAMNVSLFVPVAVMLNGGRGYTHGGIPLILIAAFTMIRIGLCIYHYRKSKKARDVLVAELRTIDMMDSLAAALTFVNTLIHTRGVIDAGEEMGFLWLAAAVLSTMFLLTWRSMRVIRLRSEYERIPEGKKKP